MISHCKIAVLKTVYKREVYRFPGPGQGAQMREWRYSFSTYFEAIYQDHYFANDK